MATSAIDEPLFVCATELTATSLPVAPNGRFTRAKVLALQNGRPVAFSEVPLRPDRTPDLSALATERTVFEPAVRPEPGTISIVIPTHNRPLALARALESIRHSAAGEDCEVIVVDNGSSTTESQDVVNAVAAEDDRFHLIVDAVPNCSRARNRGLAAASGRWVAYLDDDGELSDTWFRSVREAFAHYPDAQRVCGLGVPAELDTPAQRALDYKLHKAVADPVLIRPDDDRYGPVFPYLPIFGGTDNCVVERDVALAVGGFREHLGPGTPTKAGEDLEFGCRLTRAGVSTLYTPDVWLWSHQRATHGASLRQIYGYGIGLSAFYLELLSESATRREVLGRFRRGAHDYGTSLKEQHEARAPRSYTVAELAGLAMGPFAYLRSRIARRPSPIDLRQASMASPIPERDAGATERLHAV